jgi:crotonobetainyl-CoA:carnitine CoA-transferase CaiB-like acyl-CoA transferase
MHRPETSGGDTLAVASPLNFSGLSRDIRMPTPEAGKDTDEVLRSVGYSETEIADWRERGIV